MKTINRAQLRGKPLDLMCKRARTTRHECGPKDNRVFCFGLADCMTEELVPTCRHCKALVDNAEPLDNEKEGQLNERDG